MSMNVPRQIPANRNNPIGHTHRHVIPRHIARHTSSISQSSGPCQPSIPQSIIPMELGTPCIRNERISPRRMLRAQKHRNIRPTKQIKHRASIGISRVRIHIAITGDHTAQLALIRRPQQIRQRQRIINTGIHAGNNAVRTLGHGIASLLA